MTVQAKILSFAFPTSTGNLAVTGVGFQPQFVRFWYNGIDGTGTATSTAAGNGMMHAGGQGATYVTNAADGVEGRQRVTSSNCITVVNTSGTVIAAATYVSFGSDGFTINVGTAPAAAFTVDVLCLAGDGMAVQSGIVTSGSSPVSASLSGTPSLLWLFGNAQSNFTGNQGSYYESLVVATDDVLTTGGVRRRQADGSGAGSGITTARAWRAVVEGVSEWDVTTLNSSGFTLTRASGSGGIFAIWVALSGINVAIGTLTQPSSTGTQTITAGVAPAAVVLLGGDTDSDGTYPTTGAEYVRGASDGSAQFAHWYGIISGSSPTPQGGRARSATRMLASYTQGTPTLDADAAIDALLGDGFRLNWQTADATARVVGWLALGNPAVVSAVGSASGAATVGGTGAARVRAAGTVAGVAAASAAARITARATGAASGATTATGSGRATARAAGTAAGASTVAGAARATARATATAPGEALAVAVGRATSRAVGAAAGTATAAATGAASGAGSVGSASGAATASGAGRAIARAAGTVAGVATALGVSTVVVAGIPYTLPVEQHGATLATEQHGLTLPFEQHGMALPPEIRSTA